MGKHEKKDMPIQAKVMPNEWYEARIKTLERENLKLNEQISKFKEDIEVLDAQFCDAQYRLEILEKFKQDILKVVIA